MDIKNIVSDNTMDEIVNYINSKVNLPILNEEQERILFKLILGLVFQLLGIRSLQTAKKTTVTL